MAVPLRVLAGRRQLTISQASFLPGGAERSDLLTVGAVVGAVVSVSCRLSAGVVGGYLLVVLRRRLFSGLSVEAYLLNLLSADQGTGGKSELRTDN